MSCTELFVFGIYSTIIIGLLMAHQLQTPVRRPWGFEDRAHGAYTEALL